MHKPPESLILLTIKSEEKDNAQNKKLGHQEYGVIKIFPVGLEDF